MKKQLLKSALIAVAGIGLLTGSALAAYLPTSAQYWTLADFTAGTDGTANMTITFDQAVNNVAFGVFTADVAGTSIVQERNIFESTDAQGTSAVANFIWDSIELDYDLNIVATDALGNELRDVTYDDFGLTFGFYFIRDAADPDRKIYSDSYFDQNTGGQTMSIVYDDALNDAFVRLNVQESNQVRTVYAVGVNDVSPVPEPATMMLFGTGLLGLAAAARRRKIS